MTPQGIALRPVRWTDLPALKRMRSLPAVQAHLRHPQTNWPQHLRWFWRIHHDPTCKVWAVTRKDVLLGTVGFHDIAHHTGELSVLCVDGRAEAYDWEYHAVHLAYKASGLLHVWGEVYDSAPAARKALFAALLTRVRAIPAWVRHKPFRPDSHFYWTTLG